VKGGAVFICVSSAGSPDGIVHERHLGSAALSAILNNGSMRSLEKKRKEKEVDGSSNMHTASPNHDKNM